MEFVFFFRLLREYKLIKNHHWKQMYLILCVLCMKYVNESYSRYILILYMKVSVGDENNLLYWFVSSQS